MKNLKQFKIIDCAKAGELLRCVRHEIFKFSRNNRKPVRHWNAVNLVAFIVELMILQKRIYLMG
ncbi:MAG: hypothetical protein K2N75_02055 [Helicobacter sp.]|uniref:hypothetical protein n=1 Tax=Helicobacter sp. TaxID=218 RepID=UPI0023D107AE|nr:hypothetical protein [Helicobacter sp.]MDE5925489.1 hypothetical protein [Helicobacter sp.]MDE7174824.1 hypothetical protein [Helicobacter sp.]